MSDKVSQTDAEQLFASTESDSGADAVDSTKEEQFSLEGEEKQTEEKIETSKAEVERQKKIGIFTDRVMSGEVDINNLPASDKWLKPYIEERMNAQAKVPEIEKLVEKKFAEKEEKRKFDSLKAALSELRLTSDQKSEVQSEFKDLLESGLSRAKALEKAMKLAGISVNSEDQERRILKQRMAVPEGGYGKVEDKTPTLKDPDFFKKLPPDTKARRQILKDALAGRLD